MGDWNEDPFDGVRKTAKESPFSVLLARKATNPKRRSKKVKYEVERAMKNLPKKR